jgi:murein DD-endopeptidase MepM/ murein hydrolase activator NlpD
MRKLVNILITLVILITGIQTSVKAQTPGPYYVVQPGDTLNDIAGRFGVSTEDLISVNQITNPDILSAGTQLLIPGLPDIQGILTTQAVPLGMDLEGLILLSGIEPDTFISLNRITSPNELYAGAQIILLENETSELGFLGVLKTNDSWLEMATSKGINAWTLALSNDKLSSQSTLPGTLVLAPSNLITSHTSPISDQIELINLSPLPLVQGNTAVLKIETKQPATFSGSLNAMPLHFFQDPSGFYYALQGIHAMATPGLTQITINGTFDSGEVFSFSQMLLIKEGYFAEDPPLEVDPATIDPANTKPEEDMVRVTTSGLTAERYWSGMFLLPVDEPWCIKSWYGNRRSYNSGPYDFFHTGVDYGVCATFNIYSAADGVVVFAGPLTVRGNTTYIDHGQGVYTGYFHQKEIQVKTGDKVTAGQLIGQIGSTGRVTGPHLHWEVWVNGIQVEPLDWLETAYP